MSLPDGFLDELRTRLSLAQVVGRKVIWDPRKSNQGKGDMWAPCPFHQEKTASFHVDDRKGFYYCFGCHAKGDAISFVRETENVGFMEAVEILASEAGLQMPARDPRAQEKADRRTELAEVMEKAVRHYKLQLQTAAGGAARDYLAGRGLDAEACARWDIGFAPDQRQGVLGHLTSAGVAEQMVIDAGLAAKADDGRGSYDRFRGRIIFPIRDGRGRAIALGGRAMDPNARAKYLNSPETELFDKGRQLYNLQRAREAAGKGQTLVVAEGYMDVIALAEAGFEACVAPLGTAITEDQLRLMWRISPEPVIALDGDRAGLNAAYRLIDLALPLIEAGQSLRFALMPEGMDPDDVLKRSGRAAMEKLLTEALPMVRLLWRRETEGRVFDSPERRAALDKALRDRLRTIADTSLRRHYADGIAALRRDLFDPRPARAQGGGYRRAKGPGGPADETRASALARADGVGEQIHEAVILATLIRAPDLLATYDLQLDRLEVAAGLHADIRAALLACVGAPGDEVAALIAAKIAPDALENLLAHPHVRLAPPEEATLEQSFATLAVLRGHAQEVEDAAAELTLETADVITRRLAASANQRDAVGRLKDEDDVEFDVTETGARIRRDERHELDKILGDIDYSKGGRKGRRSE